MYTLLSPHVWLILTDTSHHYNLCVLVNAMPQSVVRVLIHSQIKQMRLFDHHHIYIVVTFVPKRRLISETCVDITGRPMSIFISGKTIYIF